MNPEGIQDEGAFGDEPESKEIGNTAEEQNEEGETEGDSSEESQDDTEEKSAVIQKKKFREKYEKERAEKEALLAKLAEKEQANSEKKPTQAKDSLRKLLQEIQQEEERERLEAETLAIKNFTKELDEVLAENPDRKEDDILDIAEKLKVSPKQAVLALKLLEEKEKTPKMPKNSRGSSTIKVDEPKNAGQSKDFYSAMADAIRSAKSAIQNKS